MTNKKSTWGTPFALAVAVVMVCLAYLVPHWGQLFAPSRAQADTTDALLKTLATKDSDGDGLPDWEEALYGTDPHKVDTFGLGMSDAQAVAKGLIVPKAATLDATASTTGSSATSSAPLDAYVPGSAPAAGSLTEQFTQTFFAQYLAANGGGAALSSDDLTTFVTSAIQQLQESQLNQDAFTLTDVKTSGSGAVAVRAYAVRAEAALGAHLIQAPKSELLYLTDALSGDASALDMITKLAQAYTGAASALINVPTPSTLAADNLALANALAHVGSDTQDLAALNRDPLLASLGLANYTGDIGAMRNAFVSLAAAIQGAGVVLAPGDPGYSMVSITPANGY